jgi:hypothetical protein
MCASPSVAAAMIAVPRLRACMWTEAVCGIYWRRALPDSGYAAIVRDLDTPAVKPMFYVYVCRVMDSASWRRSSFEAAVALVDEVMDRWPSVHRARRLA